MMGRPTRLNHLPIICGIYKLTSPNCEIYIGQSEDVYWRWVDYTKPSCKNQWLLYRSLKRHGWENFTKEILIVCKERHLDLFERSYEKLNGSWNTPWGLNATECGRSRGRLCDKSKAKSAATAKANGKQNHPHSPERKTRAAATRAKNGTDKRTTESEAKRLLKYKETIDKKKEIRFKHGYTKLEIKHSQEGTNNIIKAASGPRSVETKAKTAKTKAEKKERELIEGIIRPKKIISKQGIENISKANSGSRLPERKAKSDATRVANKERKLKEGYVKPKRKLTAVHTSNRIAARKLNKEKFNALPEEERNAILAQNKAERAVRRKAKGTHKQKQESIEKGKATRMINSEKEGPWSRIARKVNRAKKVANKKMLTYYKL